MTNTVTSILLLVISKLHSLTDPTTNGAVNVMLAKVPDVKVGAAEAVAADPPAVVDNVISPVEAS